MSYTEYYIMEFEWDELKNEANKRNHGVSFETAAFVFRDENRIEIYDDLHSKIDEDRYITIGRVKKNTICCFY